MSGPSIQPFFIFSPDYMSWEDWNGSLLVFYSELGFPYSSEENWRETAQAVSANPAMATYPAPSPDKYDDWQTWAKDLTEIVNGQSY